MFCFSQMTETFCHEASLPFLGKSVGFCGITFDIFTHVFALVFLFFLIYLQTSVMKEENAFYNDDTFTMKAFTT